MKKLKIILIVFLALLLAGVFSYDFWVSKTLEPLLKKELASAFGMPFDVEGVRINLLLGTVSVDKIVCLNPEGFKRPVHFSAEGIHLTLNIFALKKKCIHIRKAHFKKALFAIESYMTQKGSRTNVLLWYHHMGLDEDDPPEMRFPKLDALPPNEAAAEMAAQGKWRVKIDHLVLDDGTFIFDDRRQEKEYIWTFDHLKGYWDGFDYISKYTSNSFNEYIKLDGTFGLNPPAQFSGEGKCQFADGDNFDLHTQIAGGSIAEYDFLLSGLPGEVKGGTFDLFSRGQCLESDLKSKHLLTLRSLQLSTPDPLQKLLKYPFNAALKLLETKKNIELEVEVNGYIGDPKFHFFGAFTKAFQKSLLFNAKEALKGITLGTVKIAAETPDQMKNGASKFGDLLNDTFNSLPFSGTNGNDHDANAEPV